MHVRLHVRLHVPPRITLFQTCEVRQCTRQSSILSRVNLIAAIGGIALIASRWARLVRWARLALHGHSIHSLWPSAAHWVILVGEFFLESGKMVQALVSPHPVAEMGLRMEEFFLATIAPHGIARWINLAASIGPAL